MIDDYRGLAVFVTVADAGSLTAAGKRLKLSTSVVSHHLSRLEEKLGVTLFFRSTRSMSLTPEGHLALDPARRMVAAGEEALGVAGAESAEPVGKLRITMPAFGERSPLRRVLWKFAVEHPRVTITLHGSDHPVDIVKEGFDLAIRLGRLADSSLKSRRVANFQRVLVASPDYLASHARIKTPDDLSDHAFVAISQFVNDINLESDGESVSLTPRKVPIEVNSVTAAKSAVIASLGIRQLPLSEVEGELASGDLVRVLPDWSLPLLGIYAVWPDAGPQKMLTRRLIDFFLDHGKRLAH
ncbi:LysR family transcriptional regulator [Aliiroseovarius sp. KMU-50]|uniref:LysR family transcriptional regulator n=1 Tax=Aliiroseovarius salicola TaxID=3009082 RepID=A0ABT4W3L1_9RHOB|nr:LysR family transcriptional regulator [Aliiroseovarius sp. KMU-50]MDA5095076.1 LysR family transcriptional regulator [Aliiroseovarius sp. KMU-50]